MMFVCMSVVFISYVLSSCCHGLLFISLITVPLRWSTVTLFPSANASEHTVTHNDADTCAHTQLTARENLTAASFEAAVFSASATNRQRLTHTYMQNNDIGHTLADTCACQQLLRPLKHIVCAHMSRTAWSAQNKEAKAPADSHWAHLVSLTEVSRKKEVKGKKVKLMNTGHAGNQ